MKFYLTVMELLKIHESLIEEFGGSHGLRDKRALEAAVMRPQSGYYENIFEEGAALMESLAMNHPFLDGNKRMAFFATDTFLRLNGYYIDCETHDTYRYFIQLLDASTFNFANLSKWLEKHSKPL